MKRTLLNLLTALSLLLCGGVVALWVRGRLVSEEAGVRRADAASRTRTELSVRNYTGGARLAYLRNVIREQFVYDFFEKRGQPPPGRYWIRRPPRPMDFVPDARRERLVQGAAAGFALRVSRLNRPDYSDHAYVVYLPCWFLFLLTALLPARWLVIYTVRLLPPLRKAKGLCPRCGYDLRATPERCPECGTEGLPLSRSAGRGLG
jgi:hypothetical protein